MTTRPTQASRRNRLPRLRLVGWTGAIATFFVAACTGPAGGPDMADIPPEPQPHPEEAAVVAVVEQLFEAMRTNDGEMAAAVFHAEARMGRATEEGISFGPVDGFVQAVGRAKEQVWDEPIWDWTVHVDGRLAQMWTKYAFYLDDQFSHCGSDAFELYKSDAGWQVTQLVDTSRQEECWYPPGREPEETSG